MVLKTDLSPSPALSEHVARLDGSKRLSIKPYDLADLGQNVDITVGSRNDRGDPLLRKIVRFGKIDEAAASQSTDAARIGAEPNVAVRIFRKLDYRFVR